MGKEPATKKLNRASKNSKLKRLYATQEPMVMLPTELVNSLARDVQVTCGMTMADLNKEANLFNKMIEETRGKKIPEEGTEYTFAAGFLTMEMMDDFPYIEKDFFDHRFDKLNEYSRNCNLDYSSVIMDDIMYIEPMWIMQLIYNGARQNDDYCIALITKLYKLYHKKEYNRLKKYRTVNVIDIMTIAEDARKYDLHPFARIVAMAELLGIKISDDCSIFNNMLWKIRERDREDIEKINTTNNLSEEERSEATAQLEEWTKNKRKPFKEFDKIIKFCTSTLRDFGFSETYFNSIDYNEYPENVRKLMTDSICHMKRAFQEKTYTFEEIQHYAGLLFCIAYIVSHAEDFNVYQKARIGIIDQEKYKKSLFKIGSVQVKKEDAASQNTAGQDDKVNDNIPPDDEEEEKLEENPGEMVEKMKAQIRTQKSEYRHLREEYESLLEEKKSLNEKLCNYENEKAELAALREYVYRLEQGELKDDKEDLDEIKKFLAQKTLTIIGGHNNWTGKLKKEFPKWKFISVNGFTTATQQIVYSSDKVFFFSDYLNHCAYEKYISVVREHNIPFSYLHGVNVEATLREIYRSVS